MGKFRMTEALPWSLRDRESFCNAGDMGSIPGSGRYPGEGNGNSLHILAWEITRTEEPSKLQSMGSPRVRHNLATEQQQPVDPTI